MGDVWTFFLSSIFSLFFLPLFGRRPDTDCLKGPFKPKQPTNQISDYSVLKRLLPFRRILSWRFFNNWRVFLFGTVIADLRQKFDSERRSAGIMPNHIQEPRDLKQRLQYIVSRYVFISLRFDVNQMLFRA